MFMHDSSVDNKNSLYADDSSFYTVGNTVAEIEMNLNWPKMHFILRAQSLEWLN